MQENILFFSDKCSDTTAFLEGLEESSIVYKAVNITDSMANLRQFLKLRDSHPNFKEVIEQNRVGIPCLYNGRDVVLDVEEI